ncbi:hypothetical protein CALVIDRAFT_532432 [Calocera viscosa TUFC12733]|uniref:Large ribosomal subunit protein uL23m n=1 Tax=Calocera viscosa (strain TUFC12733) TaxID=1330018 RepID=A0A167S831_CALVF|nr:hypothetical protein CALVIDRAFT_532432 [Calocera viscosa TUFC12733]
MLLHGLVRLEASSSQALSRIRTALPTTNHRLYVTKIPQPPVTGTGPSVFTYSPRAVRIRRHRFHHPRLEEVDGVQMSDSDKRRWEWLLQQSKIPKGVTAKQWLEERYAWRNRLRGVKYGRKEPSTLLGGDRPKKRNIFTTEEALSRSLTLKPKEIVGQRIYLPNFVVRLVRNTTPLGRPYDPYIATFRVPRSLTKMDIKSYLLTVYGVETTFIRTENYVSKIVRNTGGRKMRMSNRTYKRAIVGLVDAFYYPEAKEDMTAEERAAREQWEEENFNKSYIAQMQKEHMATTQGFGIRKVIHGNSSRSRILKEILRRRAERDGVTLSLGSSGAEGATDSAHA